MPEENTETDEMEEALDLPEEQDHSEEQVEEEPEEAQAADEGEEEEVQAAEESGDEPETETAPVEEKTDVQISDLMEKLEALEKSNSGLYADLKAERERRKTLMSEIEQRAQEEEQAKQEAERASSIPDKEEDPVGYIEAIQKQRDEEILERLKGFEENREEQDKAAVQQQVVATVNADEESFRQEHPDYDDALNYARQERARLIRATHPDQPDEWVNHQIALGDRMFALQSLQNGVRPSQRAYDYAVRLGYESGGGNGGEEAAESTQEDSAPAESPESPKQKPKMTSLSSVSGKQGGRGRKITYKEFANLDTDSASGQELFDRIASDDKLAEAIEREGHVWI